MTGAQTYVAADDPSWIVLRTGYMIRNGHSYGVIQAYTYDVPRIRSIMLASLAVLLWRKKALAGPLQHDLVKWINDVNSMALDLKNEQLSALEGQRALEGFYESIDFVDLMRFIDFDRLAAATEFPPRGEKPQRIAFPLIDGMPSEFYFHADSVGLKRGRSIPPHGHNNQVTSFLVLQGEFHGRNFEGHDDGHDVILTPTIDAVFRPGGHSSISDQKDNAHWFTAVSETAFLFDLAIINLHTQPSAGNGRVYLDLRGGDLGDGRICAKRTDGDTCYAIYG